MDQATEQRLNEIREREKQATPLPWVCSDRGDGSGSVYEGTDDDYLDVALLDDGRCPFIRGEVRLEDGIFAAHARSDVPFLLELVTRYEAELAEARMLFDAAYDLDNFAWSAVDCDCEEATEYLRSLIQNLRGALARQWAMSPIRYISPASGCGVGCGKAPE